MLRILTLAALAACGSSTRPADVVVAKQSPPPAPHTARNAMTGAVIARLDATDLAGLTALTPDRSAALAMCAPDTRPSDVDAALGAIHRDLGMAIERFRGSRLEIVTVHDDIDDDAFDAIHGPGNTWCPVRPGVHRARVRAKVRVMGPTEPPFEATAAIPLVEVGGRWYLADAPRIVRTPTEEYFQKLEQLTDRVCSCTDSACVRALIDERTAWYIEYNTAHGGVEPGPDQRDRFEKISGRFRDCVGRAPP